MICACEPNNKIADNCIDCASGKLGIFTELTADEISNLEAFIDKKSFYSAGEILIQEKDSVNFSICVNSGYLIIGSHLSNGTRQIYQLITPGETIAFSHKSQNSNYFVRAITDVNACIISNKTINTLITNVPKIAKRVVEIFNKNTHAYQQLLLSSSRKDATQGLAYLILHIKSKISNVSKLPSEKNRDKNFFPLNQEDMADIIGLTKVHVSRVMSQFKKDRIIDYSHRRVEVIDTEKLKDIASYP